MWKVECGMRNVGRRGRRKDFSRKEEGFFEEGVRRKEEGEMFIPLKKR